MAHERERGRARAGAVVAHAFGGARVSALARALVPALIPILVSTAIVATAREAGAQRLPLRVYTSSEGLAGDHVTALLPDSRGFLWIGTKTGLSRFDGREFRHYGPSDGLPHASVNALLEDRDGTLWIGTRGGLVRIDPHGRDMSRVTLGDDAAPNVLRLVRTRDGHLWVAARDGLYVFANADHRGTPQRVPLTLPTPPPAETAPLSAIEALSEGRDGDLWIGTSWGLLRRLPDGRLLPIRVRPTPLDDRIFHLAVDRDGRVWITHWGLAHRPGVHFGLYVLVPEPLDAADSRASPADVSTLHTRARPVTGTAPFALPTRPGEAIYITAGGPLGDGRVHAVTPTADGTVWIATETGLVRVDGRGVAVGYDARNGLGMPIQRIATDAHANLWLGTRGMGLVRFEVDGFVTYAAHEGFTTGEVMSILEDATGTLCLSGTDADGRQWFGTIDGDRLVRFMPRGTEHLKYWGWGWHQLWLQDHTGDWWVPTGEGLFRYPAAASCRSIATATPKAIYRRAQGLANEDVFRLFEDSRGDLWVSAGSVPMRWVRATGRFEAIGDRQNEPTVFAEDRAGNVWIGFYRGGLVRWQPPSQNGRVTTGTLRHFETRDDVPAGFVHTLFVDARGRLWIGSESGGVARIDDPTAASPRVTRPSRDERLIDATVHNIVEDGQQQMYIASSRGLLRVDPTLTHVRLFSTPDGLASHDVKTAFVDRHGRLWFGTHRGLSRFVPQQERAPAPAPIFIDSLRIGGVPQPLSQLGAPTVGELRVEPASRRVEIGFGSPSLAPGDSLRYQVRLHGADPDWGPATPNRTALYLNLAPGTYRFEARAVGGDGRVSARPATATLVILPPIWQRAWFQVTALLILIGMGYVAYRSRVARLLALERVRAGLAKDLHDDLGARLSRISILSEVAARRVASDTTSAERLLDEVGETARSLIEATADITWSVDPRQDDLASLIARIRHFAADLLEARDIAWTFDTPANGAAIHLAPEHRRHVLLVFQEAINNIVRHARARHVALRLGVDGTRLAAEIADDGCGFDADRADREEQEPVPSTTASARAGRGLANMAARARELGGRLSVTSAPGQGTRVHLTVALR